jgi:protein SCO1/2
MPAMAMNFDVPDPALLESLEPGQHVDFVVEFTGRSYRVVAATVLEAEGGPGSGRLRGLADASTLAPDFELIDQSGREVRLSSLRGRNVVLDFVYTNCPGPCPILTSSHVTLQRSLSPALREKTWFVSITLDPARDTPEALHGYASARGADLSDWWFVTGPSERVEAVVAGFGVGSILQPNGEIDHLVATFLIDAEGRIDRRYIGLDHDVEELRRDLERLGAG